VRGIVCNWSNVVSVNWGDYDILGFNEIWGIKEFENLKVEGYEIKTIAQRQLGRGGGSMIYTRKEIDCTVLTTPFVEGVAETTGIKIGEVYFINVYRPPSGNKQEFVEVISAYLNSIGGVKVIIGGDLNLNILGGNTHIDEVCNQFGLVAKISGTTRIASNTCIDNFLTNLDGVYKVSEICIADHQAITAIIELKNVKKPTPTYTCRQMKEYNWALFNHLSHQLVIRGDSNESRWNNLLEDIKEVVDVSFPKVEKKVKYTFTMSPGLMRCRDKKNRLLRKYKRGQIRKEEYVRYNNTYRKLIRTEQSKALGDKLVTAGNNGKLKWKALKEGLHIQAEQKNITELCVNGEKITDKEKIAKAVCEHFKSCATKLTEGLPQGQDTSNIMPQGPTWDILDQPLN